MTDRQEVLQMQDLADTKGVHYAASTTGGGVLPNTNVNAQDLERNLEAKIKNPLQGISKAQLMQDVDEFAREHNLVEHTAMLRKGALIAQSPDLYDTLDGPEALTDAERHAIYNEIHHKWRLPWRLYLTIATCSIGAAVQGWDQTGSNGATLFFPSYYGIGSDSTGDQLIVGLVNAGPYIGCALLGCWLSDPINNIFGRRGVIFFASQFCIWPVLGSAFCETWEQQLANRLLMGIGMGAKAATVPIYAAENAPAAVRGALVMSWQMWTAFGIMLGTCINLAVYELPSNLNWRFMLGFPLLPAVPLCVLIYLCPESPRWYMKKGRYADAWRSMVRLRHNEIQVARDIYYIHAQLAIEHQLIAGRTYMTRFKELFTVPRIRRANLAAFIVMFSQQLCGINIIAFYSTTIFKEATKDEKKALIASFGFGLINWLFAFPAFYTIDTFGRRSLLLFTFPNMMWSLLAAGLFTLLPDGNARTGLVALFVYIFCMFYSPGEGPVPFTYAAEVYPLSHREIGMGFAVAVCLGWAGVLGFAFPFLLARTGTIGAFAIFAGFNLWALIMIFLWVPETKQRTLEELDYVFAMPTRDFMKYQITEWLPWFIKRYVFFQKHAFLRPLYTFDSDAQRRLEADLRKKGYKGPVYKSNRGHRSQRGHRGGHKGYQGF